jgi:hypothetical protein
VAGQGYGQTVNKSKTLDDGTVFTINGVIADDNALLVYYALTGLRAIPLEAISAAMRRWSSPTNGRSESAFRSSGYSERDPVSLKLRPDGRSAA